MSSVPYTIPLNAYPLAGTDGTAIPVGVTRPGWVLQASEYSSIELPDELNYVTIHVESPVVVKEVGNILDPLAAIDPLTTTPQARAMYLACGEHQLILCRHIIVSGACTINGHTLWQQMAPTTKWRTQYGNPRP